MPRDEERARRVARALDADDLDAVVCALPMHVLMLSGYWPVVGTALALATRDGRALVLAPEDERELAERGWAAFRTFQPGALDELRAADDAVRAPFAAALRELGAAGGRVGYERGPFSEPASYAAMTLYGGSIAPLLEAAGAQPVVADATLADLRAIKTPAEVERLRLACGVAGDAFARGAAALRAGLSEAEVAAGFQAPLATAGLARPGVARAGGFVWCMSGPNAAEAGRAYARSRARRLQRGEFALVHCNSQVDGYWTDVTRTFCLGEPDERQRALYAAVLAARAAALDAIRPGARAADVDRAARETLAARGYGDLFTHGSGHGVGFEAISANARPRVHPASDDTLEAGMVFNVEPATYIADYGGLRHCDMVAVTEDGVDVLTPFQSELADLVRPASERSA